jgi:AraC-like DNA-binding protein
MVQSGQSAILTVEFASRRHAHLPVEVLERRDLFARMPHDRLARPERPTFHMLMLIRSGKGTHTVDFETIEARSGRAIWVRPGQVQSWDMHADFDASLVLSRPIATSVGGWFPGDRAYCDLEGADLRLAEVLIEGILGRQHAYEGSEREDRLLVALFDSLAALHAWIAGGGDTARLPSAYVAFREAVEADLGGSHDVTTYAARLGYSPRTLSRACRQATGQTAKAVLSDRLVLEAQRLLVHTDLSVADIAARLGFSEAANFGKFFSRRIGTSPARFRATGR